MTQNEAQSMDGQAIGSNISSSVKALDPADRKLGRYRLCFEIASGGMATLFIARIESHAGFDKIVALKRIHPHLAKEKSFVDMFLDEARIASRINHPNVCNVFDFGEFNGSYYIAMEYLSGEPLSRCLKAVWHRPDLKDSPKLYAYAARIIADAGEGLHAAHELRDEKGDHLNVVHRDVSPHNLFVTYDGNVSVVDFGIASARNRIHNTTTGEVKGKFAYMAPEQLRGKGVDRRADVWSLGVILWEMVTMKRLFRRKTEMETIFAVASEAIPSPSSIRENLPVELEEIIVKALTRDPDQRYQTARDLSRDLFRFLTKRGEVLGSAELSEWMDNLFPQGAAQKRELLEKARVLNDDLPPADPVVIYGGKEGTRSGVDTMSGVGPSLIRKIDEGIVGARTHAKRKKFIIAGFGMLCLAGIMSWILLGRHEEIISPSFEKLAVRPDESKPSNKVLDTHSEPSSTDRPHQEPSKDVDLDLRNERLNATHRTSPDKREERINTPVLNSDSNRKNAPIRSFTKGPNKAATKNSKSRVQSQPSPSSNGSSNTQVILPSPQGAINIVTPGGWAYVFENGRRLGQTPTRLSLPVGNHVLEIRPFGEPPSRRVTINVKPNEVEKLIVRLGE